MQVANTFTATTTTTGPDNKKDEREVWEEMTPEAWHNSIARKDSIFHETYIFTKKQIEDTAHLGKHDVIIEIGCGTGDVIGELELIDSIPSFGLDINPQFIEFCRKNHTKNSDCEFIVQDATKCVEWWKTVSDKYKKPLVVCVNNTLNIMPEEIRSEVMSQMFAIAGPEGRLVVSYWNGHFFSHAVLSYYKTNEDLCGSFGMKHVDWENRTLETPSSYVTEWHTPTEVQKILRAYDVDIAEISDQEPLTGQDHINTQGLAIFAWFSQACTSRAKSYYDSEDAQTFYSSIWGDETVHIGRYDLLTSADKESLSHQQSITKAQQLHELQFIRLVQSKFSSSKVRILDMGCGYGGLLRRLWEAGLVWSAIGCDISGKMCAQARRHNEKLGCDQDIEIHEESYLDVSLPSESVDLVISMDALLHVGPDRQHKAVQEAARVLRPGGWMIFTDILQGEVVDEKKMQPIYDRIHLSKLGTISNYQEAMEKVGFGNFSFEEYSSNVSLHYGTVREVLLQKGKNIGLSEEYFQKMEAGLRTWRDLAPDNIRWGFLAARKVEKVDLDSCDTASSSSSSSS